MLCDLASALARGVKAVTEGMLPAAARNTANPQRYAAPPSFFTQKGMY